MRMNFVLIALMILLSCKQDNVKKPTINKASTTTQSFKSVDENLKRLNLPDGFKIEYFAEEVENARSICLSPKGTLFVGTMGEGKVYALKDTDGDDKADKRYELMKDGNMPNGVAWKDGDLYVAEVNRILLFKDIENNLENTPEPIVLYDEYPKDKHHGWKFIAFGPDGNLYVPVGAPCNICLRREEIYASITRLSPDGSSMDIIQRGIRNTVGFNWHPETGHLWFTDNGGDRMGDDIPACELNVAIKEDLHFGYPHCHQGDILDEEYGKGLQCSDYVAPAQNLGAHVAPLGIEFYTGDMFPASYKNNVAFIAEHGSWNRSKKSGYRITLVKLDENQRATSYEPFITGWLEDASQDVSGRPVDIEWMPDGSMLISDDFASCIYRVSYDN